MGTRGAPELVRETRGGEPYEYYPLGKHAVIAPGVCDGRPTLKGARFEARVLLDLLAANWSQDKIVQEYRSTRITQEAIAEAVELASTALLTTAATLAE